MRPESSGMGTFMNMKAGLVVLSVLLAAGLLAACSPVRLLNALTPSYTFSLFAGIPYGSGERHVLDVYLPTRVLRHWPADASAGAPVVVFFYGGSWQSGERNDYLFVGEALASRGFVAVLPDYRTYPATTFPGFIDDAAQAVAWAREHAVAFGGDPRRLFLMGHSAGAQIAALLATDGRYLAAREMRKSDIAGVIGLAGAYDFLPLRVAIAGRCAAASPPWRRRESGRRIARDGAGRHSSRRRIGGNDAGTEGAVARQASPAVPASPRRQAAMRFRVQCGACPDHRAEIEERATAAGDAGGVLVVPAFDAFATRSTNAERSSSTGATRRNGAPSTPTIDAWLTFL